MEYKTFFIKIYIIYLQEVIIKYIIVSIIKYRTILEEKEMTLMAQQAGFFETYGSLILLGLMFVLMYFFMIKPQKKQEQEVQRMRNELQVGDEITTIGGIIGKIISIKEETVLLETSGDKTKIRILKNAVKCVDVKAEDCE